MGETIRLWMSKEYFVALGRGGKVNEECDLDRCRIDGVPVIRRISGGGTVLQGPGCLNFSLVLRYDRDNRLRNVRGSYRAILEPLAEALKKQGHDAECYPISDLAVDGRKVSGNAQARKKNHFLHHGTLLFDFDLEKIPLYLRHPTREPEYRNGRAHSDFVTNLAASHEELESIVRILFPPDEPDWVPSADDLRRLGILITDKFATDDWNLHLP